MDKTELDNYMQVFMENRLADKLEEMLEPYIREMVGSVPYMVCNTVVGLMVQGCSDDFLDALYKSLDHRNEGHDD